MRRMRVLGIESSCDETGLALYDSEAGLLAHALHSQIALHDDYGGVVPELASRDHVRHCLPLLREVLQRAKCPLQAIDAVAYTQGPGLSGALLVGASIGASLAFALGIPALGVHHLEGHLLSPLLEPGAPDFPFVALLVSGGHSQLMRVDGIGRYTLLGDTLDDAAGEAFDKTAKLLGLAYPGGPALSQLAEAGDPARFRLPRPMLNSGDLNFSFSGLKTAVLLLAREHAEARADIARAFQDAVVDVLSAKALAALRNQRLSTLVVAGGVGANRALRTRLDLETAQRGWRVHYPKLEFCTDNGAMIAYAGAQRLAAGTRGGTGFTVRPRWDLADLPAA